MPGVGVFGAHRADHFGGEHNVLMRNDFQQCGDARLVIDAGIEVDVVQQVLFYRGLSIMARAAEAAQ